MTRDAPAIPFVKEFSFGYGKSEALSPLVRRVVARNPGPFTFTGTGTYIVGRDGDLAVIDPGPEDAAHLSALLAAVGAGRVGRIFVTHTHRDHCAGAQALAARTGAPVWGAGPHPDGDAIGAPALDEGGDRGFRPDRRLADGEVVAGDGWTIEAVATPGHLSNHLCYALREEGALFTGDHIMGWSTTVVAPPEGDMGDYLASLDKLLARDDRFYLPTHGAPIRKWKTFVRAVRAHRRSRDAQILEQLKIGRATIGDIVPVVYAGLDPRLHGAAALTVYAHLIRLIEIGAIDCDGAPSLKSRYRPIRGAV
jgi:glyoxylase-like metal-dependent hydrolase (beta-lactamase superfamily II)